jgi:hypothetical protein
MGSQRTNRTAMSSTHCFLLSAVTFGTMSKDHQKQDYSE